MSWILELGAYSHGARLFASLAAIVVAVAVALLAGGVIMLAQPWRADVSRPAEPATNPAPQQVDPPPEKAPAVPPAPSQVAAPLTITAASGASVQVNQAITLQLGEGISGTRTDTTYSQDGKVIARPHAYVLWQGGSWKHAAPYTEINKRKEVEAFLASAGLQRAAQSAAAIGCLGLASNRWMEPNFRGSLNITETRAEILCSMLLSSTPPGRPEYIFGIALGHNVRSPETPDVEAKQRALVFVVVEPVPGIELDERQLRSVLFDLVTSKGAIHGFDPTEYSRVQPPAQLGLTTIRRETALRP